jgi:hypothetical protein
VVGWLSCCSQAGNSFVVGVLGICLGTNGLVVGSVHTKGETICPFITSDLARRFLTFHPCKVEAWYDAWGQTLVNLAGLSAMCTLPPYYGPNTASLLSTDLGVRRELAVAASVNLWAYLGWLCGLKLLVISTTTWR